MKMETPADGKRNEGMVLMMNDVLLVCFAVLAAREAPALLPAAACWWCWIGPAEYGTRRVCEYMVDREQNGVLVGLRCFLECDKFHTHSGPLQQAAPCLQFEAVLNDDMCVRLLPSRSAE